MSQSFAGEFHRLDRCPGRLQPRSVASGGIAVPHRSSGVPGTLKEVVKLGRTVKKRAADILAYFDHPGTSNGPTETINCRLEHLHGAAFGFRNLTNYVARSLREAGGFRPDYTIVCEVPVCSSVEDAECGIGLSELLGMGSGYGRLPPSSAHRHCKAGSTNVMTQNSCCAADPLALRSPRDDLLRRSVSLGARWLCIRCGRPSR